jgi:hypothetical protein
VVGVGQVALHKVLAVQAAVVLAQKPHLLLELLILVVVVVLVTTSWRLVLAALVLSSCPYQQPNTQAQPQAHQQSPQAAQIQF